ncbi:hypothetical protein [Hahella ganghwensis]|uniref:hypothetical protein n=1 Tax=Hahella ganghwensis TaxID=286420 RepID=UPI00035E909D|nr:hypothetical protein [Hahella ganghwensis]
MYCTFNRYLQRWISRVFCFLLFSSGVLISVNSLAAQSGEELLQKIHQARLQTYLLLTDYYNFSANVGDKHLLEGMAAGENAIDSLIKRLSAGHDSPEYLATLSQTQEHWVKYKSLLSQNINDLKTLGYHELQLVFQLAQLNVDVGTALGRLYQLVIDQKQIKLPDVIIRTRHSAFTMAVMMTKYSARSTSNISQVFQGEDPEETLDILAGEFDRNLGLLINTDYVDTATNTLLKKAQIKWNFIRSSYMNYNENNVNFVVNLYSRQIIESLDISATAPMQG